MQRPKKASSKWPVSEWEEFDRLTSDTRLFEVKTGVRFPYDGSKLFAPQVQHSPGLLGLTAPADLAIRPDKDPEQDRLVALWRDVKSQPTYKRLLRNCDFDAVLEVFRKQSTPLQEPGEFQTSTTPAARISRKLSLNEGCG